MTRDTYIKHITGHVQRLLSQTDRNPFSPTYGCMDRDFWHYKISDYPHGTSQLGSLMLALAYLVDYPGNIFYKNKQIRELAIAAIGFRNRFAHNDGTMDDYYPYERALGSTCFSLYGCSETYILLKLKDPEAVKAFRKAADWLLAHDEPGKIANHQFIAALALYNVYRITGERKYADEAKRRIRQGISWASKEGWFYEYEGCDPGYLTFSISFLAKYFKLTGDKQVEKQVLRAIEVASYFIHPDGSYGGIYGSRNTMHFMPHGFELIGTELATQVCDSYIEGMKKDMEEHINDDRYFVFDFDYLLAYRDYCRKRNGRLNRKDYARFFEEAGILVWSKGPYYAIVSAAKGNACRIFKDGRCILNDSGITAGLQSGRILVTHLFDKKEISWDGKALRSKGSFNQVQSMHQSPFKMLLFRLWLNAFGWMNPVSRLTKSILTRLIILGKKKAAIGFERTIEFGAQIKITDAITSRGEEVVARLSIGTDNTSIYIPTSRYYQKSALDSWKELDPSELNEKKSMTISRAF